MKRNSTLLVSLSALLVLASCEEKQGPIVVRDGPAVARELEAEARETLKTAAALIAADSWKQSIETSLSQETKAGEAQRKAIQFTEAKETLKAKEAEYVGRLATLEKLEKEFRALKPPGRDLRQLCLSDEIGEYLNYGQRLNWEMASLEKYEDFRHPDRQPIFMETLTIRKVPLESVRDGSYKTEIMAGRNEDFHVAVEAARKRERAEKLSKP